MRALVLCHVGRRHVRPQRAVRRRPITGSPQSRSVSRRGEGLPGYGAILFVRALVVHPAGYAPLLAHSRRGHCCLRSISGLSASGKDIGFGAAVPRPARSHAYASQIPSLQSAQGLLPARAGSPLAGRDSHPLDDKQSFMESSHPPIPIDPQGLVALEVLSARHYPLVPGTRPVRRSGLEPRLRAQAASAKITFEQPILNSRAPL
jgi:hypothetical protein